MNFNLKYGTYKNCILNYGNYDNGRIGIQIQNIEGPIATVTVNIPEYNLPEGHVLIKNWGENEGVLEEFIRHGIIKDTGKIVPTGFVEANECILLKIK